MYISRSIPAEQWEYCISFLLFGRDIYLAFLLGDYGSHYGIVLGLITEKTFVSFKNWDWPII